MENWQPGYGWESEKQPGYGWGTAWLRPEAVSWNKLVVKLPCSVAVTDRATGVRRCLGDWTSRDIYLKSYHSDLAAIYLDYYAALLPRRGRILRRTLSVCLSVRPVIVAIGNVFSSTASVTDVLFGTH